MDFITVVLRMSRGFWVALCLENGLVGQGETKEKAIEKLKEAVVCYQEVNEVEDDVYNAPLSVKELHEFLTVDKNGPVSESYELRAVYA